MKKTLEQEWRRMRAEAGAPAVPALDTASIMDAVRAEAAARPARRLEYVPMEVPRWMGTVAASLAFIAALGLLARAVGRADREIGLAWARSVEPTEFVQNVMPSIGSFGGRVP
jgi:hypothetical protein